MANLLFVVTFVVLASACFAQEALNCHDKTKIEDCRIHSNMNCFESDIAADCLFQFLFICDRFSPLSIAANDHMLGLHDASCRPKQKHCYVTSFIQKCQDYDRWGCQSYSLVIGCLEGYSQLCAYDTQTPVYQQSQEPIRYYKEKQAKCQ